MFLISEIDLIPCLATFICCLAIKIEIGILVGIGVNIVFILYQAARPKISLKTMNVSIIILR
jgi:sodium-independent sulfate anion transporter 11